MKFALDATAGRLVEAYEQGRIRIAGQYHVHSVLVAPDRPAVEWRPASLASLRAEDFAPIVAVEPQVVVVGTGRQLAFPATAVFRPLVDASIGYEVMDTGAACRTYNLLASEGRRVIAALIVEAG